MRPVPPGDGGLLLQAPGTCSNRCREAGAAAACRRERGAKHVQPDGTPERPTPSLAGKVPIRHWVATGIRLERSGAFWAA